MNKTLALSTLSGLLLAGGHAAKAEDAPFTWEGSIEIGVDSTIDSTDPTAELTDVYLTVEGAFEAALGGGVSAFGGLTLESMTGAADDRAFEDIGLYVSELGLRFSFADTTISAGKISPTFAKAWDEAPGFYGTSLAEDYELAEMLGAMVETPLGQSAGTLSFAAFYADTTILSDSVFEERGQNNTIFGGASNTGELNNFAIQWDQSFGDTGVWIGARFLSKGTGDASDETGVVAGVSHDFGNGFAMLGEVAHFDGFGGSPDDATYAMLGGSYAMGDWTFSATGTMIENSATGRDHMFAVGLDRSFANDIELNLGIARFDVTGDNATAIGAAIVIPLGG